MSLINQMLKDLDARTDVDAVAARLPNEVRALPKSGSSPARTIVLGFLLVVAVGGYLAYSGMGNPESPSANGSANTKAALAVAASPPVMAVAVAEPEPPAATEKSDDASAAKAESKPLAQALHLQMSEAMAPVSEHARDGAVVTVGPVSGKAGIDAADKKRKDEVPAKPERKALRFPAAEVVATKEKKAEGRAERAEEARIAITAPVATPKDLAELEYRKAVIAMNQQQWDAAILSLQRALRENSLHGASRQLLVKVLLQSGRVDDAMRTLKEGLQEQPAQIAWAMSLARLEVDRGNLETAWNTLDQSLPAAGRSADYQGFAGHVLHRLGRFKEAAKRYQAASEIAPMDGRWWLGLGLALEADGQPEAARESFLNARKTGSLNQALKNLVEQKLH